MRTLFSTLLAFTIFTIGSCKKDDSEITPAPTNPQDQRLRMNQIQLIASHNSYRQMTTDTVFAFLLSVQALIPPQYDPMTLDYDHEPLADQLSQYGVRGLELDIYNDPSGTAFSDRFVNSYVGLPLASGIPDLSQPGMKLLHIKDVDYNSHYPTFKLAIQAVKAWSLANPNHLPLFINVETKSDSPGDDPFLSTQGFTPAPVWDAAAAEALEQEVRDVFGPNLDGLFTPDMLKGTYSSLENAALQGNWPLLGTSRGKIIFIMEGNAVQFYKQGHPSLSGRSMFVYDTPGQPEAAFVILNDARADSSQIRTLVQLGYMVRTRCDSGTLEARNGDYSGMNAAFASGAQILSTDYYRADYRAGQTGWTEYQVKFPGGNIGRKNPVNASGIDVEEGLTD
ncbi:MAG: Ca2+-dependent phosphoinositide-specific phospholipase C [Bacteroidota bacterium]